MQDKKVDWLAAFARRREFLVGIGALAVAAYAARPRAATAAASQVAIEEFSAAGKSQGVIHVPKVIKSAQEWRAQLSPLAFNVARQEGTEVAFTGDYANHAEGLYRCICCDTALYDSQTKYDSGTGWPSFWKAISAHNVVKSADGTFGMQRDAITCRRCDAHLGHVFDDGAASHGIALLYEFGGAAFCGAGLAPLTGHFLERS